MHFMLALASLLGLLASAFATSLPWPEVAPQFNGILAGHTVSLNGTIQEMMSQAVAMYPDFNPNDIKKSLASRTEADNVSTHSRLQNLALRIPFANSESKPGW